MREGPPIMGKNRGVSDSSFLCLKFRRKDQARRRKLEVKGKG